MGSTWVDSEVGVVDVGVADVEVSDVGMKGLGARAECSVTHYTTA